MIYERRHTRLISEFGGLARQMPMYFFLFLIVLFSSIGLPLLNGFIGEFLILLGAYRSDVWVAVFSTSGVIWGAVYMLWMFQRFMFGPLDKEENKNVSDLNRRELAILIPIVVVMFWIGLYSNSFLRRMDVAVDQALAPVRGVPTLTRRAGVPARHHAAVDESRRARRPALRVSPSETVK
jgi:NADH-quinone oxidoreductase subunit M